MGERKAEIDKSKNVLHASLHIAWILIVSFAIIALINELFKGSDVGKIVIIVAVTSYIIFSFAQRYWKEKKTQRILSAIDTLTTLTIGVFLIIMSYRCTYCNYIGASITMDTFLETINLTPQPNMIIFYIGVLLAIVAGIRVYLENHRLKAALKKF